MALDGTGPYTVNMAKALSVEEAVQRAEQAQRDRIEAIRTAVEARQNVTDVRAEADRKRAELEAELADSIAAAERADVQGYSAALSAGWTETELRKIGLDEPEKKQRVRKRAARKPSAPKAAPAATEPVESAPEPTSAGY